MTAPRALIGLWFAALVAVSWFLYARIGGVDFGMQNQIMLALRELKQLDAEWNAHIVRSRLNIHTDNDQLMTPLQYLHELDARLRQSAQSAPGGAQQAALLKLQATFSQKQELVEQFESQNAGFRNSLHYFLSISEEVKALLRTRGPVTPEQARRLSALELKIHNLLTQILSFNLMPEAGRAETIVLAIDDIERSMTCCPGPLQQPLGVMITHARIILQRRMGTDAVAGLIAAVPTSSGIDELGDAFNKQFEAMLNEKQQYRKYMVLYSAFLLILLGYASWRLMKSYKVIAEVNQRLQSANEALERRVAERTAELVRQSAQLAELATHDALTGLVNRRELMVRLSRTLQRAERRGWVVAVMFIDLDGFKAVNDTYGHATGDLVLQEVAARVLRHVRQEDLMARLGGDEFVVVLSDVMVQEGVIRIAEAALREISAISEVAGCFVQLSASIGISSVRGSGPAHSAEMLLSQADKAMYQAKQKGKNSYCFGSPSIWGAEPTPTAGR